jgi:hypothetical protein
MTNDYRRRRIIWLMAGSPRRVFLSHTAELRQFPSDRSFVTAAERSVISAGDVVTDMAYFTARDEKPAALVQEMVRNCDIYVGLIGLRYGSPVRDRPEVSYAELEFDTAREAGLPQLVFMLDENSVLPIPISRLIDRDSDLQARQRAFQSRLMEGLIVSRVNSPDQLERLLFQALMEVQSKIPAAVRGRIFLSYRREEAGYPANWLYGRLSEHFGEGQIFMDVDAIEPGANFVDVINNAVGSCEVLLALIGDRWLTLTDMEGKRRIDDPRDFVNLEIKAALGRNIRVIPILINEAKMPRDTDLPSSIAELAYHQAVELSPNRFDLDVGRLLKALDNSLSASRD